MAIARSSVVLLGTSESSGDTITNNSTDSGSEVDVLGGDASGGVLHLFLIFTSTVTAGSLDVSYNPIRVTGGAHEARAAQWSVSPVNGTKKYYLGAVQATRYASANVFNNATGASATNVAVLGDLYKVS